VKGGEIYWLHIDFSLVYPYYYQAAGKIEK